MASANPFVRDRENPFLGASLPPGLGRSPAGGGNPFIQPEAERERGFFGTLLREIGRDFEGAAQTAIAPFGEVAELFGLSAPVTFEDLSTRDLTGAAMVASLFVGGGVGAAIKGAKAGVGARAALPVIGSKAGRKAAASFAKDLGVVKSASLMAASEGAAGAFFGGVRPLEAGEERLEALISDTALFAGLGGGFSMLGSGVRATVGAKLAELKGQAKNAFAAQIAQREEARIALQEFAGVKLNNPETGVSVAIRRLADGSVSFRTPGGTERFQDFGAALNEALTTGFTERLGPAKPRVAELKAMEGLDPGALSDVRGAGGDVWEALGEIELAQYQGVRDWAKKNFEQTQEIAWLGAEAISEKVDEFGVIALRESERDGILSILEGSKASLAKLDDSQLVREALKQGRLSIENLADGANLREHVKEIFLNDQILGEGVAYIATPAYDTSFLSHVLTPQTVARIHPEVRPIFELADQSTRVFEQAQRGASQFMSDVRDTFSSGTMRKVAKIVDENVVEGSVSQSREAALRAARETGDEGVLRAAEIVTDRLNHTRLKLVGAGRLGQLEGVSPQAVARARQIVNEAAEAAPNGADAERAARALAEREGLAPVVDRLLEEAGREGYFPIAHQVGEWRLAVDGLPSDAQFQLIHPTKDSALKELDRVISEHGARNASILPKALSFDSGTMGLVGGGEFGRMVKAIQAAEGVEISAKEAAELLKEAGTLPTSGGGRKKFSRFLQQRKLGWREFTEDPLRTLEFYLFNSERTLAFNDFERNASRLIDAIPQNKSNLSAWAESYVDRLLGRPTRSEEMFQSLMEFLSPHGVAPRALKRYSSALRRWTTFSRLGGAMSGLVNSTQIAVNTAPLIGVRWTGEGLKQIMTPGGLRELRAFFAKNDIDLGLHMASSESGQLIAGEGIKADIASALKRAKLGEGRSAAKAGVEAFERMWMFAFNGAERLNRAVTAWGAYQKGIRELNMGKEGALAYAREMVEKTQFNYRQSNIPLILQGPVGSLLGQFKTFFINEVELIASVDNATRMKMGAAFTAVGGLSAITELPGADVLDYASEALFDRRISEALRVEGGRENAPDLSRFLAFGAPGLFANVDLSQYVGPGGFFELTRGWAGPFASDAAAAGRFAVSAGGEVLRNGKVSEETFNAFFQRAVPSQVRRIQRGLDIVGTGEVRNPYTKKLIYRPTDRLRVGAMQALGPPTTRMSAERTVDELVSRQTERYTKTSANYGRQIGLAAARGANAELRELLAEARSRGVEFDPSDVRRWAQNMTRSAAERRERRTPLALRDDLQAMLDLEAQR